MIAQVVKRKRIHFCPHCENIFYVEGVSFILTFKCPHCGKLQNIRELHHTGARLIADGLAAWSRMLGITDEIEFDDEDAIKIITEFTTIKRIISALVSELTRDLEIRHLDDTYNEETGEREMESYFDKNPRTSIPRGKVTPG
jgi:phage FluMu protein Com